MSPNTNCVYYVEVVMRFSMQNESKLDHMCFAFSKKFKKLHRVHPNLQIAFRSECVSPMALHRIHFDQNLWLNDFSKAIQNALSLVCKRF